MATSATSDPKSGLIISHIIRNGATKVTKRLALKRIRELKPANCDADNWTIDAFLQSNRKTILDSRTGRSNEWMFFPDDSVTDIDKWDVSATIFILIETCDLGKKLVMYLEDLRKLRNKIVHYASTKIEENKFKHYQTKLSVILDECLKEVGDEALEKDIEIMYQQLNDGTIFSKTSENQHHGHAEEKEALEKEDRVADETIGQKLNTTIDLLHRIEPAMTADNEKIDIPEFKITIEVQNCPEDKKVALSQRMVEIFNDVIYKKYDDFQEQTNEFRHKLREAVYETCLVFLSNGRPVNKAEEECMLLNIRCISLIALMILFRDYINGILDKDIQALQSAVRRCIGYEECTLDIIVFKDDFWEILKQTGKTLEGYVATKENSQEEHRPNDKTLSDSSRVHTAVAASATQQQSNDDMEKYTQEHSTASQSEIDSQNAGEVQPEENSKEAHRSNGKTLSDSGTVHTTFTAKATLQQSNDDMEKYTQEHSTTSQSEMDSQNVGETQHEESEERLKAVNKRETDI